MARVLHGIYVPPRVPEPYDPVDIREHARRIVQLYGELGWWGDQSRAWFELAAGIEGVLVDMTDHSTALCGRAHEYESRRSDILEALTTEVAIFSFLWNGFECLTKEINPTGFDGATVKQSGRDAGWPARAIYHLRTAYEPAPLIDLYQQALSALRADAAASSSKAWALDHLTVDGAMGESGWGLYLVSQYRNDLAHGSASLPQPGPTAGELTNAELLAAARVRACSRVLLTTVQMMVWTRLAPEATVAADGVGLSDEPEDIDARGAVQALHRRRE